MNPTSAATPFMRQFSMSSALSYPLSAMTFTDSSPRFFRHISTLSKICPRSLGLSVTWKSAIMWLDASTTVWTL